MAALLFVLTTPGSCAGDLGGSVSTTVPAPDSSATTRSDQPSSTGTSTSVHSEGAAVSHPAGFNFTYPVNWEFGETVVSTVFANGADCIAAAVVDDPPPDGSASPSVSQSGVQVCALPLDGRTLLGFMEVTYGADISDFQTTTLGGKPAYTSETESSDTYFLASETHLLQVVTFVTGNVEWADLRRQEVAAVLSSFLVK